MGQKEGNGYEAGQGLSKGVKQECVIKSLLTSIPYLR